MLYRTFYKLQQFISFKNIFLQMELEKQRVRFKEENSLLIAENEELRSKLEEVKGDIVSAESFLNIILHFKYCFTSTDLRHITGK